MWVSGGASGRGCSECVLIRKRRAGKDLKGLSLWRPPALWGGGKGVKRES